MNQIKGKVINLYDELIGLNYINMIKSIDTTATPRAGNTEITVRCPFCGDSKNLKHQHLYISIPHSIDELSFYHCKLCSAKGIVDEEFLRKIGCYDSNLLVNVAKHNSEVMSMPKYKQLKSINIYPLHNKYITDGENTKAKLNYINRRMGANFTYNDILALKIILNLKDVIRTNRLELTRYPNICDQLDKYFIGFISYDNSFCTMRKVFDNVEVYNSINNRYVNYHLLNKIDESKNYYVIPTQYNILSNEPIKIHITEGAFDVLSVFYNLNRCNYKQSIYIASGGKSYYQALKFILEETGIINYELHIYPDKDVSDNEFDRLILNKIGMLPCAIYIHRNIFENEKDYGVPLNRIKDSCVKVSEPYG